MEERNDETEAYNMALHLNNCLTPIFLTSLVLEAASFYLYTNMVAQIILKYSNLIIFFTFLILYLIFFCCRCIRGRKSFGETFKKRKQQQHVSCALNGRPTANLRST